jgi:hypothetical protein
MFLIQEYENPVCFFLLEVLAELHQIPIDDSPIHSIPAERIIENINISIPADLVVRSCNWRALLRANAREYVSSVVLDVWEKINREHTPVNNHLTQSQAEAILFSTLRNTRIEITHGDYS